MEVDNDVSMHNVVGLVVVIPTSPRSSKTESGCKIYHRFRNTSFPVFSYREFSVSYRESRYDFPVQPSFYSESGQ